MDSLWGKAYGLVMGKLSSRGFMIFIIVLFVVQALWVALSFRYPMLYDEVFHVDATKLYSQQISPFITDQPTSYDAYGNLSNGTATAFHYLMSFPYRIVSVFTDNVAIHVIILRIIDIAMAAMGIFLFGELFKKLNVKQAYINIALLVYILIPITTFIAATTSYDNMLLPLTALYLIICVNILKAKKVNANDYFWLISVGCAASLVKFTFLPVFVVSVLFLAVFLYKKYSKQLVAKTIKSFKKNSRRQIYGMAALALITVGWFSSIYIYNIVAYRSLQPSCEQVMSEQRCDNAWTDNRNDGAKATRDTRPLMSPDHYTWLWMRQMVQLSGMTGSPTNDGRIVMAQPLPLIYIVIIVSVITGVSLLLYAWRFLYKDISWYFLAVIVLSLTITVFLQNYQIYVALHVPYSIQPRYLLTIIPIAIVMSVMACAFVLRKIKPVYKLVVVALFFALFTQGGGVVTHILVSQDSWYWDNPIVRNMNNGAKKILHPFVWGT